MPKHAPLLAELALHQWAITPEGMDSVIASAEAEETCASSELGSLEGQGFTSVKERVGSLHIGGPIVPRANAFLERLGFVSLDKLTTEFKVLERDDSIDKILLIVDSPGGAVTGISEFASLVAGCDKHTEAYAFGNMASAAYWIASAADRIVASPSALIGSIGVLITVRVDNNANKVIIESSQSPKKHLDPQSKEGRAELTRVVDSLADVFISDVAKGRAVSTDTVLSDFGQGGLLIAAEALSAGMIDSVNTLANTIVGVSNNSEILTTAEEPVTEGVETMPTLQELTAQDPALSQELEAIKKAAREDGAGAERAAREAQHAQEEAERTANAHKLAVNVLEEKKYEKIHPTALSVLKGELDGSALVAAQAAFDAVMASLEEDKAVLDSADEPVTPAAVVEPKAAEDNDGIDSEDDILAEIKQFRGEV